MKEKILLHACCAVCMAHPIELLKENYTPVVFFCNPNIYPEQEYLRRRDELINYCNKMNYEYIIDDYEPEKWYAFVEGLENEPEKGQRCDKCFEYRLMKTAQKASEMGIKLFTTTLSVSPHKVSKNIFEAGNASAQAYGIDFLEQDFKKQNGFLKTMQIAKENDFYRQKYCGCEYSIRKENQEDFFEVMKSRYDLYNSDKTISFKTENGYEELDYKTIFDTAKNLANYLIEAVEIKKDDRIAILSESRPQYPIGAFGIIKAGAIIVPLDTKLTVNELSSISQDCEPRVLLTSNLQYEKAKELKALIPSIELIILLEEQKPEASDDLSVFEIPQNSLDLTKPRPLTDTAVIVYTSGTTGSPKGVKNSFLNICSLFEIVEMIGVSEKSTFISILPLNHSYELNVGLFTLLYFGSKIVYLEKWSKDEIFQAMKDFKATDMFVVPLFLNMLKSKIEEQNQEKKFLFNLKLAISGLLPFKYRRKLFKRELEPFGGEIKMFVTGGSKLDIKTSSFFEKMGVHAFQGYGLTESGSTISTNYENNNKPLSVGKPIPNVKVKIAPNGELLSAGPHIMPGYYNKEELTREILEEQDGEIWLHTGDIAEIDKDGYIYITGRIRNMIVLCGGKNVFPEEVEPILNQSDLIKELCIIPTKITEGHNIGTEQVTAVIVPCDEIADKTDKEIQQIIEQEVKRLANESLAPFKHPSKIILQKEPFAKTPTGKISRRKIINKLEK